MPIDRLSLALAIRREVVAASDTFSVSNLSTFMPRIAACDGLNQRSVMANIDGVWTKATGDGIGDDGALRVILDGASTTVVAGEIRLLQETD